jgi:L-alanine-DL-glutamate epimerase-like enolase superfamily enzyme
MALWDARGKALGQPVYALLGGARKKFRAYAGGVAWVISPPPQLLAEAQRFVAQGYTGA